MSLIVKTRTKESYLERMKLRSINYQKSIIVVLRNFEKFVFSTYHKSFEEVITELLGFDLEKQEVTTTDLLQDYVSRLNSEGQSASGIKIYFGLVRRYRTN